MSRAPVIVTVLGCSLLLASACAPQMKQASGRNPDLFSKESDGFGGRSRGNAPTPAPEMFIRQKKVVISDANRPNETGSLFNPDNERNHLFTAGGPTNVGRFLKIDVVNNRSSKPAVPGAPAPAPADPAKDPAKPNDEVEQELLKALPDLAPAAKGDPALLSSFKMQILHRYPNGDVLARMERRSSKEDQTSEIVAEARIPYDKLAAGEGLTTDDLLDVKFAESGEGELIERHSSAWEDEYSMRLSGFTETKSKAAAELDDQKLRMAEAREKLETRIKAVGDERRMIAKTRDDLAKKKAETEAQVKDIEGKLDDKQKTIEEQEETIKDQQETIQDLKPEEKPGDEKEGNNG